MILIGRGLDLGEREKGEGNREQEKRERTWELGTGTETLERKFVRERRMRGRTEAVLVGRLKGNPTCAVLRVRSLELRAKRKQKRAREKEVGRQLYSRTDGAEARGSERVWALPNFR